MSAFFFLFVFFFLFFTQFRLDFRLVVAAVDARLFFKIEEKPISLVLDLGHAALSKIVGRRFFTSMGTFRNSSERP